MYLFVGNGHMLEAVRDDHKRALMDICFVIAEFHAKRMKAVKLKGEFIWHHLEKEDELFLVVKSEVIHLAEQAWIAVEPREFVREIYCVHRAPLQFVDRCFGRT